MWVRVPPSAPIIQRVVGAALHANAEEPAGGRLLSSRSDEGRFENVLMERGFERNLFALQTIEAARDIPIIHPAVTSRSGSIDGPDRSATRLAGSALPSSSYSSSTAAKASSALVKASCSTTRKKETAHTADSRKSLLRLTVRTCCGTDEWHRYTPS